MTNTDAMKSYRTTRRTFTALLDKVKCCEALEQYLTKRERCAIRTVRTYHGEPSGLGEPENFTL